MYSPLPTIFHLGAEHQVTGSCHLLRANGFNIMVDCGAAQGGDLVLPMKDWLVPPSEVDYLFLTHAHIDHVGRVPEIVGQGFSGEIVTTQPTKAFLGPMLMDSMTFSAISEEWIRELEKTIDDLSWGFEYQQKFDLKNGIKFTLYRAGHILCSCFIRFEGKAPEWSVIFSGDLGGKNRPILCDPDLPEPCDVLILESTCGDKIHDSKKQRIMMLGSALEGALNDGGKVFIPAFALGRTQELIYEMDRLFSDSQYS